MEFPMSLLKNQKVAFNFGRLFDNIPCLLLNYTCSSEKSGLPWEINTMYVLATAMHSLTKNNRYIENHSLLFAA